MDCRIMDYTIVSREGSIVSVPPNNFTENERYDSYYGVIQKIIQNNEMAQVKWCKDQTVLTEDAGAETLLCLGRSLFIRTDNQ